MYTGKEPIEKALSHSIPSHIRSPTEAKAALTPVLSGREIECFIIIHLSDQLENLQFTCHRGSGTDVLSPARKIITDAAELGTKGLLLAHNHPSGLVEPSQSDLIATRRLVSACEALDVTIVDHLIYGRDEWFSFREKGYL